MINIQINHPVMIDGETFSVRFTADCYISNDGIGSYEYCGSVEIDKGHDYVEVENIKWDEHLYTLHENNVIRKATRSMAFGSHFENGYYNYIDNLDIL